MSYPPYSPFKTSLAPTYQEPLLKENPDHFVIFLIEHDLWVFRNSDLWIFYKKSPGISLDC